MSVVVSIASSLLVLVALLAVLGQSSAYDVNNNEAILQRSASQPTPNTEQATSLSRRLFNAFKSYANTPMADKPPQYSRKNLNSHDISDYLTNDQKRMKSLRNAGSVAKENSFDESWSGHSTYKSLKSKLKTKLSDAQPKPLRAPAPAAKAKAKAAPAAAAATTTAAAPKA